MRERERAERRERRRCEDIPGKSSFQPSFSLACEITVGPAAEIRIREIVALGGVDCSRGKRWKEHLHCFDQSSVGTI